MEVQAGGQVTIELAVNGARHEVEVEPRWLLADVLRQQLGLTGTHVGCEHGVCGCCTVLVDGRPARACLTLAVSVEGADIRTVESLAGPDGRLHPLQEAFRRHHGLQCGFCTPGFLMAALPFWWEAPAMDDRQLREVIAGQLCRCTGYAGILAALRAARGIAEAEGSGEPRRGAPVDREGSGEPRRGAPVDRAEGTGEAQGGAPVEGEQQEEAAGR